MVFIFFRKSESGCSRPDDTSIKQKQHQQAAGSELKHCVGFHGSADALASLPDSISDVNDCVRCQCDQVFLGMITVQYQAITVTSIPLFTPFHAQNFGLALLLNMIVRILGHHAFD